MIAPQSALGFLTFFIPAYIANMTPVFVRKLPILDFPIDGGKKLNGKPLLGKNKTVRGLIFGTLAGGVTGIIISATSFPYAWWWGFLIGFAALLGDALKSVVKRQMGIRSGGSFMPFDQIDFIVIAYLASLPIVSFSALSAVTGFAVIFICTILVQLIGAWTRLKSDSL